MAFSIGFTAIEVGKTAHTLAVETTHLVTAADTELAALDKQVALTSSGVLATTNRLSAVADKQLTEANRQLELTRVELTRQSENTLLGVDSVLRSFNATIGHADTVVSNPDIPKLLRDTRRTVALTGNAMSHVESTANTIAREAPELTDAAVKIEQHVGGIAGDVQIITDDYVKPKPWWKKVLSVFYDGAILAAKL